MTAKVSSEELSRRGAIVLAARVVAGGLAVTILGCHGSDSAKVHAEQADLVLPAGLMTLDSMRIVGKKYLELHPGETMSSLLAALRPSRGLASLEVEIRKQYASGEVVKLQGWVLALTEVRIYAVVALN